MSARVLSAPTGNDRLGRFGRRETTAVVALCTLISGCFGTDGAQAYRNGNSLYLSTALALLVSWLLLEVSVRRMHRLGAGGLGELLHRLPRGIGGFAAVLWAAALLLCAMLPQVRFLRAMTDFIYLEASASDVALYVLPGLLILPWLGMETLARTGRILLPVTFFVTAVALVSDVPMYALYRLYPLFSGVKTWIGQSVVSLLRFVPVVLLLLSAMRGMQGERYVLAAGRRGLLLGGGLTVLIELCLALSYRYNELRELSAPLYRLLVEIEADNAAVRLDRIVLFVWTMAGVFVSACYVYGAALLLMRAFGVGDVRPLGVLLGALSVSGTLLLYASRSASGLLLPLLHRFGWVAAVLPLPAVRLAIGKRKELGR